MCFDGTTCVTGWNVKDIIGVRGRILFYPAVPYAEEEDNELEAEIE